MGEPMDTDESERLADEAQARRLLAARGSRRVARLAAELVGCLPPGEIDEFVGCLSIGAATLISEALGGPEADEPVILDLREAEGGK